ncbi:MAG: LamG domain-containing protein, partial [Candidatus Omnitrophica bacterium]|nr:LamG domain-containing protein [Candidatus Omnitrophota bacterium]
MKNLITKIVMLGAVVFTTLATVNAFSDPIYTYYSPNNIKTKEVEQETEVSPTDPIYLKHVTYYYKNENTHFNGSVSAFYGRTYRTDVTIQNYELEFDGSGGAIDCGTDPSLDIRTGSISLWTNFNSAAMGTWQPLFTKRNASGQTFEIWKSASDKLYVMTNDGSGYNYYPEPSFSLVTPSKWYNIVLSFDGTLLKAYVNGGLVFSQAFAGLGLDFDATTFLGYRELEGSSLNGSMRDVRIYNRALDGADVVSVYNGSNAVAGAVAQWDLNDGATGTATDSVGTNNGTITGAAWQATGVSDKSWYYEYTYFDESDPMNEILAVRQQKKLSTGAIIETDTYYTDSSNRITTREVTEETTIGEFSGKHVKYYYLNENSANGLGRLSKAEVIKPVGVLVLNGSPDSITVAGNSTLKPEILSVSIWASFSQDPSAGWQPIFTKRTADGKSFEIWRDTVGNLYFMGTSGTTMIYQRETAKTLKNSDTWYNIVFTYDGTTLNGYVNGNLLIQANLSLIGLNFDADISMGYRAIDSISMSGSLKNAMLFNRALTAAEIVSLYNNIGITNGLISQWDMNEGSGVTVTDSVGGNNGVLLGADWTTTGISNDSWFYEYTYFAPGDPANKILAGKIKKNTNTNAVIETYTYYTDVTNRVKTHEITKETAVGEYNGKHVKYYYRNEDAGSGLGRVDRVDVIVPNWVAGFKDQGDSINCGTDPSLDLATLSVSAWVKFDQGAMTSWQPVFIKRSSDNTSIFEIWKDNNNQLYFMGTQADGTLFSYRDTAASLTTADTWYNISLTYDGTTLLVYVNNTLVLNQAVSMTGMNFDADVLLGNRRSDNSTLTGEMKNVRVFNRALSAAEIAALYGNTDVASGLVSYWKLNEGAGITATDSAGTNNGLVLGADWAEDGISNSSYYYEYVYLTPANPLDGRLLTKTKKNYLSGSTINTETYGYYAPSGRLESVTYMNPDTNGNNYYHYIDENWSNRGYGRVDVAERETANANGEIAFEYLYYPAPNAGAAQYVKSYTDVNRTIQYGTYLYDTDGTLIKFTLYAATENYASGKLKRKTESATGNIYEYLDEDWASQGFGRLITTFDFAANMYRTYIWGMTQVTVNEYSGQYMPDYGSAVQSDVVAGEKRVIYIYDHNSEEVDLNTGTNGWVIRKKTMYDNTGLNMTDEYIYDAAGRLTRDDHVSVNRYYTYAYYPAPDDSQYQYKYEFIKSTNTFVGTYIYDTAGNLTGFVAANDETYPSGRLKRKYEAGNIYEYLDENWNSQGYGRIALAFKQSEGVYRAYSWGTTQAYVQEYVGVYTPASGSAIYSDIVLQERRIDYLYDHKNQQSDLNTATNGWILRAKTVYENDGGTVKDQYVYDAAGRLEREDHIATDNYFTYEYYPAPNENQYHFKREYRLSTDELLITYEYATDGSFVGFVLTGDLVEQYSPSENWLRKFEPSGSVYEWTDESLQGDEWNHYGKFILISDGNVYKNYAWGAAQVTYTEYSGAYLPARYSAPLSDLNTAERRVTIVYDHKNVFLNVNTQTNGWVEREKTLYDVNGTTVLEKYLRNASGNLIKDIYTSINTYYTYDYFTSPGLENNIHYKKHYSYTEAQEAGVVAGTTQGTLLATYEYIDTDYMVKWEPNGNITTLLLDTGGTSRSNTYYEKSTGILIIYNWDASWNLISADKHYPNGNIEITKPLSPSDPVWPLVEKREPAGSFLKGVNIPWLTYGYDIGKDATHLGLSRNIAALYDKMDKRKGDYARFFAFCDLRAGIQFAADGTPIAFTDQVYEDFQALLDSASALNMKVMPVLFDYLLGARKVSSNPDVWQKGIHADLIENPVKRAALIALFRPFIAHFKDNKAIYAWDIMNEPDMANYFAGVSLPDLYAFVQEFGVMIHDVNNTSATPNPDLKVTVGCGDRVKMLAMLAYWKANAKVDPLDLLQFHYYDYMSGTVPLDYTFSAAELILVNGRGVIAGELEPTNITQKLDILRRDGYAGGLLWEDGNNFVLTEAMYNELESWFYGTIYTYYASGRLKTKKDVSGIIYEYSDENWNAQGYGKLLKLTRVDGTYKTFLNYYVGTNIAGETREFTAGGSLIVSYEFYLSGRLKKKTLTAAGADHILQADYVDEAYYDNGTPADLTDDYGRTTSLKYDAADTDGVKSQTITFAGAGDKARTVFGYVNNDWTGLKVEYQYDASNVLIGKKVYTVAGVLTDYVEYEYYVSGKLKKKTLTTAGADHILVAQYLDEAFYNNGTPADLTDDFGRTT